MKTRLVVVIIIGIIISGGFAFVYAQMYDCLHPPPWLKIPRSYSLADCLQRYADGTLPHYTQDTRTSGEEIIQVIQVTRPGDETLEEFEGVIFDKRLGPGHWYSFFTNDLFKTFNTGSTGIGLEGINSIDDLHGKIVKISGIRTERDLGIQVYEIFVLDSLIPESNTFTKDIWDVSLDSLYDEPDQYYNRIIRITGELREHEKRLEYAGSGCDTAKYTTSDEFRPDLPSTRQLYVGEKFVGVRIGSPDDLGMAESVKLPMELKNNQVEITGVFVPNIVDKKGECNHVIYKSGYILTEFEKIKIVESG